MNSIDLGKVMGTDGAAATIEIGTVSTGAAGSNASVVNVGTETEAIFNFTIPRGNPGAGEIQDDTITGKEYTIGVSSGKAVRDWR